MRVVIFLMAWVLSNTLYAQPSSEETLTRLQPFIKNIEAESRKLQGGSVAILYHGEVIYKKTFGYQRGKTRPITAQTLFPLASVSKAVSATSIALLVDSGKLNLSEQWHFPYLKSKVSIPEVLSHSTGYHFSGNPQIEKGMPRNKLLQKLKYEPLQCDPGTCYFYSNTAFSLIEEILDAQQSSFKAAITNLQMALQTDQIQIFPIQSGHAVASPHAQLNAKHPLKPLPFPPYYPKASASAAGVFASLDGMIALFKLQFGYRPDLISQKTLDIFQSPHIKNHDLQKFHIEWPCPRNQIDSYYGFGFRRLQAKPFPGQDLIFHSGYISGAVAFVGFMPSEDIGIIVLVNQNSRFAMKTGIALWTEFLPHAPQKIKKPHKSHKKRS